jgi:hypothetical protein
MKQLPALLLTALVLMLQSISALSAVDDISWLQGVFCWSDPATSTSGRVTYKVIGPDQLAVTKEVRNPHAHSSGTVKARFVPSDTGFMLDEGNQTLTFVKRDSNYLTLSTFTYGRSEFESNTTYFRCN